MFNNLPGGQYNLLSTTNKPWGGGNSTDALAIMQHFVDLNTISGLNLNAADVDASGFVNTLDAFYVQQRFINMIDEFPAGDWAFDNGSVILLNSGNGSILGHDVKALCYGDVNASYVPATAKVTPTITLNTIGTMEVNSFEEIEIPVKISSALETGAISLIMSYPAGVEVVGVNMSEGSDKLMYSASDGQLRISWYSLEPVMLEEDETLFTMTLKLKTISHDLNFDLHSRSEIADSYAEKLSNVKLTMPELVASSDDYALSNNYPNPFTNITNIEYRLPESGKVLLSVFNLVGEKIAVIVDEEQSAGEYKVEFDGSELASGAYMYKIEVEGESRTFVQTRMMIVNK